RPSGSLARPPSHTGPCRSWPVHLVGERIQRELPARVIEEQIVRLTDVVDARARHTGLDHMNLELYARALLSRGGHDPLQRADAPGAQPNDADPLHVQNLHFLASGPLTCRAPPFLSRDPPKKKTACSGGPAEALPHARRRRGRTLPI